MVIYKKGAEVELYGLGVRRVMKDKILENIIYVLIIILVMATLVELNITLDKIFKF